MIRLPEPLGRNVLEVICTVDKIVISREKEFLLCKNDYKDLATLTVIVGISDPPFCSLTLVKANTDLRAVLAYFHYLTSCFNNIACPEETPGTQKGKRWKNFIPEKLNHLV